jgi:hypothetical protein
MRSKALACVLAITLAACGGAAVPEPASSTAPAETTGTPTTAGPGPTGGPTVTGAATATAAGTPRPAFLTTSLTDVRTGERFTLGGFGGKVTIVLAMAVW